ncbi:MAG: NAD(P)-dependent oxidoreductase, partial [Catenulispora sp.]|nr:NAD(P)-dependent oxidoreductase [Catenulispora sp.]
MRILMVGGSGYVGSLMLPGLSARHKIRVLDPQPPSADGDHGVEHIVGSALDPAALAAGLDGVDAVIHAAMGRPSASDWPFPDLTSAFEVNVASVYATLDAAHRAGVRRAVLTSSMSVFSETPVRLPDRDVD